jgi:hypothetical protein
MPFIMLQKLSQKLCVWTYKVLPRSSLFEKT